MSSNKLVDTASRQVLDTGPLALPADTLHGLVAQQVVRTPQAVAVEIVGGACLSYGELFAAAQAAAERLVLFGVSRGDIVGTAVEGLPMIVTHLAILLAGGEPPLNLHSDTVTQ